MKKLKLYLDTTIIKNLKQNNLEDSKLLWDLIKKEDFEIYISETTFDEIKNFKEKNELLNEISKIEFEDLEITDEINEIAKKIYDSKILHQKNKNDSLHLAAAVINSCDYIVSWNYNNLVNIHTKRGVNLLSNLYGYKEIDIISPKMII